MCVTRMIICHPCPVKLSFWGAAVITDRRDSVLLARWDCQVTWMNSIL
jgi:hypothetical protein